MRRRTFLRAAGVGLVALIGAGAGVFSQVPVIPKRPNPDPQTALGWIAYADGRYTLTLPRAEMGQNIATALKQVACTELEADWEEVDVVLHSTAQAGLKPTVGSESVSLFIEPLAQACAALRDARASGQDVGTVEVTPRPVSDLRALQPGALIGARPEITQGREIVTGAPLFAADVRREGQLYGRVLRAPASVEQVSRPVRWDLDAAQAVPGFVAIVEECGPPIGKAEGLGIVASRPGALDRIEAALSVVWDVAAAPDNIDISGVIDVDRHRAEHDFPHVVMDGAPAEGNWDVDLRFDLPPAPHAAIEPRAAVADWADGKLSVWAGSQDVFYIRDVIADALPVPVDDITIHACRIGGGFGSKTICTVEAEAAALTLATKRPVKVQWTRAQEFAQAFHRPPSSHRIRARVAQGKITAWDHAHISSHIMFTAAVVPEWMHLATDQFAGDGGVARGMAAPYILGEARAAYDAVRLPAHTGPWRGLAAGQNALAIESAMDAAAQRVGEDPLSFRLRHLDDPQLSGVLRRVGDIADWGRPATARDGTRTGRGLACGIYKSTSYAAAVADVAVDASGAVNVTQIWCVHDCGLVINPDQVRAQCEGNLVWSLGMALSDQLPIEQGRVVAETFADAPVPRLTEVPPMTIDLIDGGGPISGAGETAIVAGPGAIANAVAAATGQRPTRFPLDPAEFALT